MKKILLGLGLLLSTEFSSAYVTSETTINDLFVYSNFALVRLANTHSNSDACTHSSSTSMLLLPINTEAGKRTYAAVLTAKTSNGKIKFLYSGCADIGSETLPEVYGVVLLK